MFFLYEKQMNLHLSVLSLILFSLVQLNICVSSLFNLDDIVLVDILLSLHVSVLSSANKVNLKKI